MRVLYVEDNEVNQALVARVMRARQNKVLFCEEGESALEILADDPDIELVLLDIELAGSMSGLDVIRTLRARNDRRPVVAITAYAMMGDRERILEAGCDQYLPKPLVIPDLLKLLDHYETVIAEEPAETAIPAVETASPAAASATPAAEPAAKTAVETPAEKPVETPAVASAASPGDSPAGVPAEKATPAATVPTPSPETNTTPPTSSGDGVVSQDAASSNGDTPSAPVTPGSTEQSGVVVVKAVPADRAPSKVAAPVSPSPLTAPLEPVEEKQHDQG